MNSMQRAGRRFSSWTQCRTAHGGDRGSRLQVSSPQYFEAPQGPSRPAWVMGSCGSSPQNGVILIITIIVAEAARSRGTRVISWTRQKHSLVQVPSSPATVSHWPRPTTCQPACLRASSNIGWRRRQLVVRAKEPYRPRQKKARPHPQIS